MHPEGLSEDDIDSGEVALHSKLGLSHGLRFKNGIIRFEVITCFSFV